PAVEGVFRKPPVVNNVETLACVPHIISRGADWFKSIGVPPDPKNPRDAGSYGPKLYCLSGHVTKPCCVELPLGVTVRELVDKYGGGVWKGRKAKGCIPGGPSMGFLTEKEFDTPLDFNGPVKAGCLGLGTAAVIVFDETTPIIDVLYNVCRFFAHESCGQCTPCREGTGWMMKITDRIRRGRGRMEDLEILNEVGNSIGIMPGTTICGLADGAGWPVKNAISKYREELEDFIRSGRRTAAAPALVGAH
ncbi:MAG: SLBB domain-containing protein, partial [Planctomycetes bacterium]|nr:SLBB domain-containing protein [Planctomycetota bacterium]